MPTIIDKKPEVIYRDSEFSMEPIKWRKVRDKFGVQHQLTSTRFGYTRVEYSDVSLRKVITRAFNIPAAFQRIESLKGKQVPVKLYDMIQGTVHYCEMKRVNESRKIVGYGGEDSEQHKHILLLPIQQGMFSSMAFVLYTNLTIDGGVQILTDDPKHPYWKFR